MISGKVVGAVGGKSCSKRGGPAGVKIELMTDSDELIASALTSSSGEYSFTNIIPGFSLVPYYTCKIGMNIVHFLYMSHAVVR
jgi:hypothetical protein